VERFLGPLKRRRYSGSFKSPSRNLTQSLHSQKVWPISPRCEDVGKATLTAQPTGRAFSTSSCEPYKRADSTPSFFHATTSVPSQGCDSAYADDLATVSRTQEGLQRKMDVVSAFASLFGLTINVKKLRLLSTAGQPVVVYSHSTTWVNGQPQWTPRRLVVEAVGSVKYLGLEIDIDGSGRTQFLTTKTTAC
jgi:hypothetical protein